MNQMEDLLRQIALILKGQDQAWALIGGLAVSVRTEPRFTRDVDLVVAITDDPSAEAHNRSRNLVEAVNKAWDEFR